MAMALENLTHDQALQALIRSGYDVSSQHGVVAEGSTATVTIAKDGRQETATVVGQDPKEALLTAYHQFEGVDEAAPVASEGSSEEISEGSEEAPEEVSEPEAEESSEAESDDESDEPSESAE